MQRWLYFVKYLRLYGWEPIVYTVENGEYPYLDEGLSRHIPQGIQVIRKPINEPYGFYRKLSGQKGRVNPTIFAEKGEQSFFKRISLWIRGNVFIPDPRVFWVRPSVHFLTEYLMNNPVDAIVSTGPPHSMHLIARNLKRKLKIPWLADFRDPWTQIYFFNQLHMSAFVKKIHLKLEKTVLNEADEVVTVSKDCASGLQQIVKREVQVITNGYEEFDLKQTLHNDDKIRMLYAGVLSLDRNPVQFWRVLESYLNAHPEYKQRFELWLVGNVDQSIIHELTSSGLRSCLHISPAVPHSELQSHFSIADLLLLIGVPGHPGVITGKFFEYMFLKKPIYSISPPNSDLVEILTETRSGYNADFDDKLQLQLNLDQIFNDIEKGSFHVQTEKVEQYSRKNLTRKLTRLLDNLVDSVQSRDSV